MEFELLVIGGGMAGAAAALEASDLGLNVALVSEGWGATSLSTGAFIVVPRGGTVGAETGLDHGVESVVKAFPHHPYGIIAAAEGGEPEPATVGRIFTESVSRLGDWLKGTGLSVIAPERLDLFLPTAAGSVMRCNAALTSLAESDLHQMSGQVVAVVGFEGWRDLDPHEVAAGLAQSISRWDSIEVEFRPLSVSFGVDANASPLALAGLFDSSPTRDRFLDSLATALEAEPERPGHVLLPPVMGLRRSMQTLNHLSENLGVDCSELTPVGASAPGFRLQTALDEALRSRGVAVLHGSARGAIADGRVSSVDVKLDGALEEVRAQAYILATGKYLGGGILLEHALCETVFGMQPVCKGSERQLVLPDDVLDRDYIGPHPLMSAGLRVDSMLRPVDEDGVPRCEDLYIAGSLIEGCDLGAGVGLGGTLVTGRLAARVVRKLVSGGEEGRDG